MRIRPDGRDNVRARVRIDADGHPLSRNHADPARRGTTHARHGGRACRWRRRRCWCRDVGNYVGGGSRGVGAVGSIAQRGRRDARERFRRRRGISLCLIRRSSARGELGARIAREQAEQHRDRERAGSDPLQPGRLPFSGFFRNERRAAPFARLHVSRIVRIAARALGERQRITGAVSHLEQVAAFGTLGRRHERLGPTGIASHGTHSNRLVEGAISPRVPSACARDRRVIVGHRNRAEGCGCTIGSRGCALPSAAGRARATRSQVSSPESPC